MTHTANQIRYITANEIRNAIVSFDDRLDTGEKLTGTPVITSAAGLTIANKTVNSAAVTVDGESVGIGKAVQFTVSTATSGERYTITIKCTTDSTPAQTLEGFVTLVCI